MSEKQKKEALINDKLRGSVIGCAVGDALGMPYETGKRGSFDINADVWDPVAGEYRMTCYTKGMPAYWYSEEMPIGCWTDDTAMTLAEMTPTTEILTVNKSAERNPLLSPNT